MLRSDYCRKGDTLVEVTIAIGIFALVAISVVSVVNISTSGAQSALEETLTREEVDSQAETLRFIQSAYINDDDDSAKCSSADSESKICLYQAIWKEATDYADANMIGDSGEVRSDFDYEFKPTSCDDIYNDDYLANQNAFIIDIKKLNEYDGAYTNKDVNIFAQQVVRSAEQNGDLFVPATTYPQLVYTEYNVGDGDDLIDDSSRSVLDKAAGMYIVGVRDKNTTAIVGGDGTVENKAAYYDFYVRSCWYNAGSETPSTVSTMLRLRDPDSVVAVAHTGGSGDSNEPSGLEPEPEIANSCDKAREKGYYMQGWSGAGSLAMEQTAYLIDKRDGKCYSVARLKDNKVWMTTNLDLAGGTALSNLDTNLNTKSAYTLPTSSPGGFSSNGVAYVYNSGDITCGDSDPCYSYYSWNAAIAGDNPSSGVASNDICSKGWRLPTKTDDDALIGFYNTNTSMVAPPFSGVYAGYYYNSNTLLYGGSYGSYWSSTAMDSAGAYDMHFYNEDISGVSRVGTAWYSKRNGASVRCVKK